MYYRIKKLRIKLVVKTSLYYDARSEKHQTGTLNLLMLVNVCHYALQYGL
jgi:hypothetical protein